MTQTITIPTSDPSVLSKALGMIQSGKIIAFPTDTVYGLGAGAFLSQGIDRLYQAKGREYTKAIAVLIGDISQLDLLTPALPESARRLAEIFWPGALTLVVPRHPALPENISAYPTVGIRMPDHTFARALLRMTGPLATTSANRSGESNPLNAVDVLAQLDGRVDLIIDGGPVLGGVPSTVVDCTQDSPAVLRQGAISTQDIQKVLRPFDFP